MGYIKLPNEDVNCGHIKKQHQKLFSAAKTVWNLASLILKEGEEFGAGNSHYLNLCLAAVYAKQMRLYLSAYRLCDGGMGNEAQLLIRSMFTTFLYLEKLRRYSPPAEFARLWLLWDVANGEKQLKNLLRWHPEWKPQIEKLSQEVDQQRNLLGGKWETFVRNGPPMVDQAALATQMGMEQSYRTFYPVASGPAHGYDLFSYARPLQDNRFEVKMSPSEDYIEEVLGCMISILSDTMAILNNLLDLKKDTAVADMDRLAKALMPKK